MKKLFLFCISALLVLGLSTSVRAEWSAGGQDTEHFSQQVFISVYNATGRDISSNHIVVFDRTATVNTTTVEGRLGNNLGAFATLSNSTVNGDFGIIGVTDEDAATGDMVRVCIRGPHLLKVGDGSDTAMTEDADYPGFGDWIVSGDPAGQVGLAGQGIKASNNTVIAGDHTTGLATASVVGFRLGDSTNPATNTTSDLIWIWVAPGPCPFAIEP